MRPQPLVLGYMRTDGDVPGVALSEAEITSRRTAIELLAQQEGLTLYDLYVEDVGGDHRVFSRVMGTAVQFLFNCEDLDGIIIFNHADLGPSAENQADALRRITDLGLRTWCIQ